jgi:hypothetical protein
VTNNKACRWLLPLIFILLVVAVESAYADSDGFYCVGPGFLAVEFRSFAMPGIDAPHILKIVRLDEVQGPRWAGQVALEDFQPHTLNCTADRVDISGAGNRDRGLVSYVVALDTSGMPRIVSHTTDPQHSFNDVSSLAPLHSLGLWSLPGITVLSSGATPRRYQLHVTQMSHRVDRGIDHDMKTVLEELDGSGKISRSLVLNEGTRYESVD